MEKYKNIVSERIIDRKNYNGVDIVKFICAFFVLCIHVQMFPSKTIGLSFFEQDNYGIANFLIAQGICRVAVPFFFVATGFFFFSKIDPMHVERERVEKFCFKLLRAVGIWMVLLFVGKTEHLWYLGASVFGVLVISFCLYKRIKLEYLIVAALSLYAVGLFGDLYYGALAPVRNIRAIDYIIEIYEKIFYSTRNGLFMGLIFVLMGAAFAYKRIRMPMVVAVIGLIASIAAHYAELIMTTSAGLPKDYNMSISLLFVAFFLFYIAKSITLADRPIYKRLRAIGVLIFYMHFLVEWFTRLVYDQILEHTGKDLLSYVFVTVTPIVILLAVTIEWLSRKEKFSFLRYLYE